MTDPSPGSEPSASPPTDSSKPPSSSRSPSETCANCVKIPSTPSKLPLRQCLRCHSITYCSKECQKADFKAHKKACSALAQEYSKVHTPKMASRATPKANEKGGRAIQKWEYDT
ncbi:hypothetical protein BDV96DRAFT_534120 [Lophiotrema nucula]|uniref:MYND-type domain-containing protein n=1 Tax=Lophiotrema nucula TaxID=690887 RepID=A0A6A5YIM1_9PLEO|nr:hypothetical protein BDV96DRAFT_534120 [Lophiotrema nucula]